MSRPHAFPALLVVSLLAGLAAWPVPAGAQCPASQVRFRVTDLGTLGGPRSYALDLTDDARVVGGADLASGVQHPFLWQNGVMIDLGTLDGPLGSAGAINASGQITGQADNGADVRRAFLYQDGEMSELPTLADAEGRGFDLNDSGQVVGISNATTGYQHGFLWDAATNFITDLGVSASGDNVSYANAINASGQIAGWSGPYNSVTLARAYLLENHVFTELGTLGGSQSVAYDLDDTGRVVGWSTVPGDTSYHAFLWVDGEMSDLGTLGGAYSIAAAAHAAGPVVGWATTTGTAPPPTPPVPGSSQHAFLYQGGEMADLNDLVASGSGWELAYASAVNGRGQVTGWGWQNGGNQPRAFLASPASVEVGAVIDQIEGFNLPKGTANSLIVKLSNVLRSLDACSPTGGCSALNAFVNEVEAQSGKKLTVEQAQALLAAAQELLATLGCP